MMCLSDANLRAVFTVLVARAGSDVHVTKAELYEAMMLAKGSPSESSLRQDRPL